MAKVKGKEHIFHETKDLKIYYIDGSLIKKVPGKATEEIALSEASEKLLDSVWRQVVE